MTTREDIEDLLDIVCNGIGAAPYDGRDCDAAFNAMPKLRAAYDALARERDALHSVVEKARAWERAQIAVEQHESMALTDMLKAEYALIDAVRALNEK